MVEGRLTRAKWRKAPDIGGLGGVLRGVARLLALGILVLSANGAALAAPSAVSCGGAAMLGGAQLLCSHVEPKAPAQLCTFSWALMTTDNVSKVVDGSFLLPPGASNVAVYQGTGFNSQLSGPIVLCQGKKGGS